MTQTEVISSDSFSSESGSFRDRDGRIYRANGRIVRGVSARALEEFHKLESTRFYAKFLRNGQIVETTVLEPEDAPLPAEEKGKWTGFMEHSVVPIISYPYEWTFSMLQDAAILQLDLVEAAILEGMTLKDATPYNIQFVSGRPVFIDIVIEAVGKSVIRRRRTDDRHVSAHVEEVEARFTGVN